MFISTAIEVPAITSCFPSHHFSLVNILEQTFCFFSFSLLCVFSASTTLDSFNLQLIKPELKGLMLLQHQFSRICHFQHICNSDWSVDDDVISLSICLLSQSKTSQPVLPRLNEMYTLRTLFSLRMRSKSNSEERRKRIHCKMWRLRQRSTLFAHMDSNTAGWLLSL